MFGCTTALEFQGHAWLDAYTRAADSVHDYIYKYFNSVRPHSHNLELPPNEKEECFWKAYSSAIKKG